MINERTSNNNNPSKVCEPSSNVTNTLQEVNQQLINLYEPQQSHTSTNCSLTSNSSLCSTMSKVRMFRVRRTFLLIVTFDVIFLALLWIIYNQIFDNAVDKAFEIEVIGYKITNSSFDLVVLSGVRFVFLMIPYALLKWSHWFFVVFTTLSSTGFIIAKTCVFSIDTTSDKSGTYVLLIASFIIAWIEIWFFDYRVLPHERRLKEALNQNERRPLLSSPRSDSIPPIPIQRHQSFYSPTHSLDSMLKDGSRHTRERKDEETSDTEETNHQQVLRNVRSDSNVSQSMLGTPTSVLDSDQNEEYEKQAEEMLDVIWRIYNDENSWYEESKSKDGFDIVISKTYPKWGKIFRLISTVTGSRADIVQMLFERQEDIPKWSSSLNDCRILQVINNNLYITYQLTNEQVQGFIAKRDFVNLTARRYIDDVAILAAQACVYPRMPPQDNCVRAENGPTAYIVEKIDESTCKFTWILNVDLKGWIPQYLINSSLATVQLSLVESLRKYLFKTIDMVSSCSSSSIDENTV